MTNFHDELRRVVRPHGEVVGHRLTADAVVESSADDIRRGRRRRAIGGGLGAVAGVSVVAIGVWSVVPGIGSSVDVATSGATAVAGPYRYVVDDVLDEYSVLEAPVKEPEVFLRGEEAVMCGDEVSLTPGVTIHDRNALGRALYFEAELTTVGALGFAEQPRRYADYEPPADESVPWDADPSEPVWDGWTGGVMSRQVSMALLMDGDTVVGVLEGSMVTSAMDGEVAGSAGSRVPSVGYCDLSEMSWDDLSELERGDPMNTRLVSQFWGGHDGQEESLLATIVVDPHEPANHSTPPLDNQPAWDEPSDDVSPHPAPDGPAGLRLPDEDNYQAFVVPGPEMSCAPFADQLAVGQPGAHNIQYEIDLPGMTKSLTGALWRDEPVLSVPTGESPWYKGLQAWIVADEVGGIEDPPLQWHGDDLSADFVGNYPMRDGECAFTAPDPLPEGSVFLIIHGVDMAAIEASGLMVEWVDPSDLYTWVYLGEAEPVEY